MKLSRKKKKLLCGTRSMRTRAVAHGERLLEASNGCFMAAKELAYELSPATSGSDAASGSVDVIKKFLVDRASSLECDLVAKGIRLFADGLYWICRYETPNNLNMLSAQNHSVNYQNDHM